MITRIVKLTIRADDISHFEKIFKSARGLIATFDGCQGVELMTDLHQTGIYFTVSRWQSEDHLNIYRLSPLFKGVWTSVKPLFAERAEAWSLISTET